MPLFFIIWDEENEAHIGEHGITVEEFREVLESAKLRAIRPNKVPGRLEAIGETNAGRLLKLVFEALDEATIYPITAFDVESRESMTKPLYRNVQGTITPEQQERFRQARADAEAEHDSLAEKARYNRMVEAASELTFSGELRQAILQTDRTHGFLLTTLLQRTGLTWNTLEPFMLGEASLPSDAIDRLMKTLGLHVAPVESTAEDDV